MNIREIQKYVGTVPDGIVGPKTLAAIRAAAFHVVIDPGHTSDHAREWPREWPREAWQSTEGRRVLRALGVTADAKDSIEHIVNVAVGERVRARLQDAGLRVLLYDDPAAGNTADLNMAWKLANAACPRAFVSIHHNASGSVKGYAVNTPCGAVTFYKAGRAAGARLARCIGTPLRECRRRTGGRDNRADVAAAAPGAGYGVLNHTAADIPAALCEVGFYDNMADLLWVAEHLDDVAAAIAGGIYAFIKGGEA